MKWIDVGGTIRSISSDVSQVAMRPGFPLGGVLLKMRLDVSGGFQTSLPDSTGP